MWTWYAATAVLALVVSWLLLTVRSPPSEEATPARDSAAKEADEERYEDSAAPVAAYLGSEAVGINASEAWSRSAPAVRSEFLERGCAVVSLGKYPPSFLRFARRLRERNDAALAVALARPATYFDAPTRDGAATCRRFQTQRGDDARLNNSTPSQFLLDASHPQLQNASDGSNLVDGSRLVAACGPRILGFYGATLQATVSPATLAAALRACPNLLCVCLTECRFDDAVARALPASLRSFRLSECAHGVDDRALSTVLRTAATSLALLDVESSDPEQSQKIPGPKTAKALADCERLAVLRISDRGCPKQSLLDLHRLCATALTGALTGALQTLHLEHRFPERTPPAPPHLVDALSRLPHCTDVDGVRIPAASTGGRRLFFGGGAAVNRVIASPDDLRRADVQAAGDWSTLRELVIAYDSALRTRPETTNPRLGAVDAGTLAPMFRNLRSLVVRVELAAGQLADIAPFVPLLRHCSLNGALTFGDFYDTVTDYDDAPGNHDGDLRALARHCRDLRVLDLSGALDAAYAVFSEAAVAHLVDRLPNLTDVFLFECGRKWDFRRVPTKAGRVNVHY